MKIKQVLFLLMLFTCINGFSQPVTLDEALEQAGRTIANSLEAGTLVALVSFPAASDELAHYSVDSLLSSMVNSGHLRVISQHRVNQIFSEFGLSLASPISDTAALMIGSLLGAQVIVTGSLTRFSDGYRLAVQSVDTSTSIIRTFSIMQHVTPPIPISQRPLAPAGEREPMYLSQNFSLAMLGYTFSPDTPVGFTAGFANFYTSWGFNFPSWLGHDRNQKYITASAKEQDANKYLTLRPTGSKNTQERQIVDGFLGYNINIIPGFLHIPVGLGIRIARDWNLFNNVLWEHVTSEDEHGNIIIDEKDLEEVPPPYGQEWYARIPGWYVHPAVELGVMAQWRFLYLSTTYAVVIPTGKDHYKTVDHRFSIGVGLNRDMSNRNSSSSPRGGGFTLY